MMVILWEYHGIMGIKVVNFECMMRSYVILIANDSDSMANDSDYIYIYGPVLRLSTPPWVGSPGSSPNSLLFASYWQHF